MKQQTTLKAVLLVSLLFSIPVAVLAVELATLKAQAGDPAAQHNLGLMYHNGRGVAQDDVLAYLWLNLAAAQGDEDAVKGRDVVKKA